MLKFGQWSVHLNLGSCGHVHFGELWLCLNLDSGEQTKIKSGFCSTASTLFG